MPLAIRVLRASLNSACRVSESLTRRNYSQADPVNPDTSLPVNNARMEQDLLPSPLFGD